MGSIIVGTKMENSHRLLNNITVSAQNSCKEYAVSASRVLILVQAWEYVSEAYADVVCKCWQHTRLRMLTIYMKHDE